MTRVLVVHHDVDLADQEVDTLRRLGYEPVMDVSDWLLP